MNINDILVRLPILKQYGSEYYNFLSLYEILTSIVENEISIDDLVIVPFYITSDITLELYDYEFNIRIVNKPNIENYLLKKTGKKRVEDIDNDIINKTKKCYIEITPDRNSDAIFYMKEYLHYCLNNNVIRNRIENKTGCYDANNLYFEMY